MTELQDCAHSGTPAEGHPIGPAPAAGSDPLTGLATRATALRHLAAHRVDPSGACTVLLFTLDRFRVINDVFGTAGGDELLNATASRLRESAPAEALIARIGSDEFVVILPGCDAGTAEPAAARLHAAVTAPLLLTGQRIEPSISVGVASSGVAADTERLLLRATRAVETGRRTGYGRLTVFRHDVVDRGEQQRRLVIDLREALNAGSLGVAYQPVVRVGARGPAVQLTGVEALARWQHPTLGAVPPSVFVAAAESAGLVVSLDVSVLCHALSQIPLWDAQLGAAAPRWVSVNLSAHHLADPRLVELVQDQLQRAGVPGERLCLEVTESVLVDDRGTAARVLERLRGLGARISVDDFGTGYSSLAYLADLPVDTLKLDRAFTRSLGSPRHRAVITAILELAEALGLTVIAEGVEDAEQLRILTDLGCTLIQGWAIARALAPEAFVGLARKMAATEHRTTATEALWSLPRQRAAAGAPAVAS